MAKKKEKFILEFDEWIDARWIINCAMAGIDHHYSETSVRHIEMSKLRKKLHKQMSKQAGKEKYDT